MLDWNAVRYFVTVAQSGSLTEASKALNTSVATLSRRIDQLETQVGTALFRRGPNGTNLTDAGQSLLAHAAPGARHLARLSRVARELRDGTDEIPVRITSTESMIADVLAPCVPDLMDKHPAIRLQLDVSNALTDIQSGDADIAIRMVRPESDTLVGRRLPAIPLGLFCAKHYLGRRKPASVDLGNEKLLWLALGYGDIAENRWLSEQDLEPAVVLRALSVRALLNATIAGAGIAPLPRFLAQSSGLIEVPSTGLPQRYPWLVFHRTSRNNKRMRTVRRWIVDTCKQRFGD
ncbi:MAG: LysR family transcriptional regulator [Pseudomonadota bacterium]